MRNKLRILYDIPHLRIIHRHHSRISRRRSFHIILIGEIQILQIDSHCLRCHQREKRISAVLRELFGEGTKEESAQGAPESKSIRLALTVGETPRSKVEWGEVVREVAVPTGECDGIAKDCTTNGVAL